VLCGLTVRRWRLIGYFPILYCPALHLTLGASLQMAALEEAVVEAALAQELRGRMAAVEASLAKAAAGQVRLCLNCLIRVSFRSCVGAWRRWRRAWRRRRRGR
jgi:hypothetical protein